MHLPFLKQDLKKNTRRFADISRRGAALVSMAAIIAVTSVMPAMAQPVLEGIATTTSTGVNTITLAIPASSDGTEAGDLLVAVIGARMNPETTAPGGWTAITGHGGFNQATCTIDPDPGGIACQLAAFWKFATGGESSVLITLDAANNNHQSAGAVFRYRSTHTVSPIGPVATQNGSNNMPTAPQVMTNEANMRVIQAVVSDTRSGDGFELLLENGPATEVFNLKSSAPAPAGFDSIVMAGAEFAEPTSGTNVAAGTWTGGHENWRGSTFTIRPEQEILDVDLSITKAGSPGKVNPGDDITYTIVAANSGSSDGDAMGATVSDTFVSALSCSWTCIASGGASCTAMGSGDIGDSVNLPVGASVTYTAVCTLDSGASGNVSNTATIAAPVGTNDTDTANNSDMETTDINEAPIAICQDVTVDANESCLADASIDDGSNDPDMDEPVTIVEDPAGPYSLGDTEVDLTITDGLGLSDSCTATVTVQDVTPPVISCNNPSTIVPADAPISFTATAEDNCSVDAPAITTFRCFEVKSNGKIIDKGESCVVSISGDTVTITDSGGVNDQIEWTVTATDGSGNEAETTCLVQVVNPNQ